jgi:hypothetical protein
MDSPPLPVRNLAVVVFQNQIEFPVRTAPSAAIQLRT